MEDLDVMPVRFTEEGLDAEDTRKDRYLQHYPRRKKATRHGLPSTIMVDISRHIELLGPSGRTLSISERSGLQVTRIKRRPPMVDEHRKATMHPKLVNDGVLNLYVNLLLRGILVKRSAGLCARVKEVSMTQCEREEKLEGKMLFWGKLEGNENDYLVCYALVRPRLEDGEFPLKKFYFCMSTDTSLRQMPVLSPEYEEKAKATNGRLRGDPSLPLDEEPEGDVDAEADEDGEEPHPPQRFLEMHRLAYMVKTIDRAVAVVPKGALLVEASRKIRLFRNFEGLTSEAARDIRNYFHFREPESIQAIAALTRKGLVRDADFLDPISADKPEGCWTLAQDPSESVAILRSLAWPGYFFFHEAETGDYGGAYFGTGLPNTDLAFML